MNQSKYAPWTFTYTEQEKRGLPVIYNSNGMEIATVHGEDNTEREATACLLSSAPELFEALKYIISWDPKSWDPEKARDLARAAIAKAEGRTE